MAPCIGIDVAKHTLEGCVGSKGKIEHARNEPRGVAQLVRRLVALAPSRVVVESTGGYERTLTTKLAEAGLPVVVVNPRRAKRGPSPAARSLTPPPAPHGNTPRAGAATPPGPGPGLPRA